MSLAKENHEANPSELVNKTGNETPFKIVEQNDHWAKGTVQTTLLGWPKPFWESKTKAQAVRD